MTDTPTPYDPSLPLRVEATDDDMRDRLNFLLVDKGYWPGAASVELAREFAAMLVAAERAKIAQDTRTAVREALLRLANRILTASRIYDTLGVQVADEIIADILYWRDREYAPLPERDEL